MSSGQAQVVAVGRHLYVYVFTTAGSQHLLSYGMPCREGGVAEPGEGCCARAAGTVGRHSGVPIGGRGAPGIEQVDTRLSREGQALDLDMRG